jgi:NADPH:quinone reductase
VLALRVKELIGPDGVRAEQVEDPIPVAGTVSIEVHAAGVGFVDLLLTRGEYQIKPELPFVPGIEVAGVVASGGAAPPDGVDDDEAAPVPGTRVAAIVAFGGFAELALAPRELTFAIPDELEFDAASALLINYQTAHLALIRRGRLASGETVLVHGAAGGVGTASVQLAKALGARVIGVAGGDRKLEAVHAAGADEALDGDSDWVAGVRELTGGRGADIVVDPVGGDRFDESLRCMAPEGRLLVVGFASGRIPQVPVNRLLLRHLDIVGVNFGGLLPFDQRFARRAAQELFGLVREGKIAPVIGSRHALADGASALRELDHRDAVGKPVLIAR